MSSTKCPKTLIARSMTRDKHDMIRRQSLSFLLAGLTVGFGSILMPASAYSAKPTSQQSPRTFRFDLILDEEKIGAHELVIKRIGSTDVWRHETTVRASVSLGIFGAITFDHHSIEEWEQNRLQKLESETDDDGEKFSVIGLIEDDEFVTEGPDGRFRAPGTLMTTNGVWTEKFCHQQEVIDAATGGVIGIVADPASRRTARSALKQGLRPYDVVSAKITGQLLYTDTGIWTGGTLQKNGQEINYDQHR